MAREDEPRHLGLRPDGHPLRARRLPAAHGYGPSRPPRRCAGPSRGLGRPDRRLRVPLPRRRSTRDNLGRGPGGAGRPRHLLRSPAACTSTRVRHAAAWSTPTRRSAPRRSGSTATRRSFAGALGAHLIIWPGGEGYNYPFQTPYAESWRWLIEGIGRRPRRCARHGRKLFLEHKNSEPAMKIHMGNIGMSLHVIHKLRDQGIDNVKVNMDWQHLIMNGEHLPEYAALLAAEGLLGHQHANSGWGTFDDDNMVGATVVHGDASSSRSSCAARTTARAASGSASTCTRTRRTRSAPSGARAAVALHRLGRGADRRRGAARGPAAQGRASRAYELVYAALGAPRDAARRPRRRDVLGQGAGVDQDGAVLAIAERGYPLSTPRPGLGRAGPRGLWREPRARCSTSSAPRGAGGHRAVGPDARARRARRRRPRRCARRSCGTTGAPQARVRRDRAPRRAASA